MQTIVTLLASVVGLATPLLAGPSVSPNYGVTADVTTSGGGGRSTSATYGNTGSFGSLAGATEAPAPPTKARHGFIGQLYDVTGLQLAASPATIDEGGTRQLAGSLLADDLTTVALPAASIAWSIQSGPLATITSSGVATAGNVAADAVAVARGAYAGFTADLGLTVLNINSDDFGSYAGDGLPDAWQVQNFGQNHPQAGPLLDPDGDGLLNFFEYAVGLGPVASSVFSPMTALNAGNLEYTYTRSVDAVNGGFLFAVEWNDTLAPLGWGIAGVTQSILSDNGTSQTVKVTMPEGTAGHRFVRLRVVAP